MLERTRLFAQEGETGVGVWRVPEHAPMSRPIHATQERQSMPRVPLITIVDDDDALRNSSTICSDPSDFARKVSLRRKRSCTQIKRTIRHA
jgi:hypothetical protein